MKKTILFITVLAGLGWLPAGAQSPAELMQLLRTNNRELHALHRDYEAALERAPQVSQLTNPEVGVGLFPAPVETRLGPQRARFSATQMFPWFGTLAAREDLAHTEARTLYERLAGAELDLAYQLRTAYYQLYENRAARQLQEERLELLRTLRQLALGRLESGQGSSTEVLRLDRRIQDREQALLILDEEAALPLADINRLLFRPLTTPVAVPDTLAAATMPFVRDTILSYLRTHHPTLRMYQWQQAAAERTIALNELERKPSFNLGLDYIVVGERTDALPSRNGRDIIQLKAGMSVPLYQDRYAAREREQQLRIRALSDRREAAATAMLADIEKAFARYRTAQLQRELYQRQRRTTAAIIGIVQADYRSGGGRLEEWLRLEEELVEYDLQLLRATVDGHRARAAIERYLPL